MNCGKRSSVWGGVFICVFVCVVGEGWIQFMFQYQLMNLVEGGRKLFPVLGLEVHMPENLLPGGERCETLRMYHVM